MRDVGTWPDGGKFRETQRPRGEQGRARVAPVSPLMMEYDHLGGESDESGDEASNRLPRKDRLTNKKTGEDGRSVWEVRT